MLKIKWKKDVGKLLNTEKRQCLRQAEHRLCEFTHILAAVSSIECHEAHVWQDHEGAKRTLFARPAKLPGDSKPMS